MQNIQNDEADNLIKEIDTVNDSTLSEDDTKNNLLKCDRKRKSYKRKFK